MKNFIALLTTLSLMTLLVACPATPAIPNINGVYSGYIQGTNGTRLTAALALRNDGQVAVSAGFAASTPTGIASFPMKGSMNGNNLALSYSDTSGGMTMDGTINSGTITGSFALNTTSGNASGTIFFTYSQPLSNQSLRMFDSPKGSLQDLSRAVTYEPLVLK
jgi:hypothetical protein